MPNVEILGSVSPAVERVSLERRQPGLDLTLHELGCLLRCHPVQRT
jgi:hypothetical protein